MESETASVEETEVVLEVQSIHSSEDPPMDEWSSLQQEAIEINEKRLAYEEGKYDPGSGEICLEYIDVSASSVFRHPYYKYPGVLDPGIESALHDPVPPVIYSEDGQDLYLTLCKQMNQCPVSIFYKGLLTDTIDLSYYYINPVGVRAMAMALENNTYVKVLNLTDNFLNDDACFHIGQLLAKNNTIEELNLEGCRIGPSGLLRILSGLVTFVLTKVKKEPKTTLRILNLNKNQLGEDGGECLGLAFARGLAVHEIHLSYNGLSTKATTALADGMEYNNKLSFIDLSWNNLFSPVGTCLLFSRLQENENLKVINLAWNSMSGTRIGLAIKSLTTAPKLTYLDLSNNGFEGDAIKKIASTLNKCKKLVTLNLSSNPLSKNDAFFVMNKMKLPATKIKTLLLDNIIIDERCVDILELMKNMKSKKNVVVTHGEIFKAFKGVGPDPRELVLNRADFIANKPKKNKVDIALVAYKLQKEGIDIIEAKMLNRILKLQGCILDEGLLDAISAVFPGPFSKSEKYISIKLMVDYIKRKWPDRRLPPTPPPEPAPEPPPKKKGKGKKK